MKGFKHKMINTTKIKYNEPLYFAPTYGGAVKISIIKLVDENIALVKQYSKKKNFKAFPTPISHIYNKLEDANRGFRDWKHYMRKRKKDIKNNA